MLTKADNNDVSDKKGPKKDKTGHQPAQDLDVLLLKNVDVLQLNGLKGSGFQLRKAEALITKITRGQLQRKLTALLRHVQVQLIKVKAPLEEPLPLHFTLGKLETTLLMAEDLGSARLGKGPAYMH